MLQSTLEFESKIPRPDIRTRGDRTKNAKREQIRDSALREHEVLALVGERGSIPIDDLESCFQEVRSMVRTGHLGLVIAQRDWGVEFEVQPKGAPRSHDSGEARTE